MMNQFLQARSTPLVIAHRGSSAHAPENTLAAFILAADQNADAIELDAKVTQDGHVVVMHDPTVDRTTDGHGPVSDLTLAEIRQLDAGSNFDPRLKGERVPLLEEVFEAVGQRVLINVELTNYTTWDDGLELKAIDLIKQHQLEERVILSSFNPFGLRKVKRSQPGLACGLLYSADQPLYLRHGWLAFLIPHLEAHHPHYTQVTAAFVRRRHARGQKVNTWTVKEAAAIRAAAAAGVDGLIGDDPILIRETLGQSGN